MKTARNIFATAPEVAPRRNYSREQVHQALTVCSRLRASLPPPPRTSSFAASVPPAHNDKRRLVLARAEDVSSSFASAPNISSNGFASTFFSTAASGAMTGRRDEEEDEEDEAEDTDELTMKHLEAVAEKLQRENYDVLAEDLKPLLRNPNADYTLRNICPSCQGGSSGEKSLTLTIKWPERVALIHCFRGTCDDTRRVSLYGIGGPKRKFGNGRNSSMRGGGGYEPSSRQHAAPRPSKPRARGSALEEYNIPKVTPSELSTTQIDWFRTRGISDNVLKRNGIFSDRGPQGQGVYCPMTESIIPEAICFPYVRDSKIVNIKYRALPKTFWQVKGAEKIMYGYEEVKGMLERGETNTVIVVEGEMDKLSLNEAGIWNVVSVPDGAPSKVKAGDLPPIEQDVKYSYLWSCRELFTKAVTIILATDSDEPGQALAEELARRIGRERCKKVHWPDGGPDRRNVSYIREIELWTSVLAKNESGETPLKADELEEALENLEEARANADGKERKDANDVLLKDGSEILHSCIANAEEYPVQGLYRFTDFWDEIQSFYYQRRGDETGVSTGWEEVDKYYKIIPGELTIVTGVPNSGKSEWLDAVLLNLSEQHGWCFAMCSMEKKVQDHARQLIEKHLQKPFFNKGYAETFERITEAELAAGTSWISDRFFLIRYEDDALPSIDWILERARMAVFRHGIRGLVIDPYNELDHARPEQVTETEYVSQMLTKLKRFAQHNDVHIWFVAHPKQLREWRGQAPNLYDISGSAHFINKCDNGIVVHRNRDPNATDDERKLVSIHVRKVRNKSAGQIGDAILRYDRLTGRYHDVDPSLRKKEDSPA